MTSEGVKGSEGQPGLPRQSLGGDLRPGKLRSSHGNATGMSMQAWCVRAEGVSHDGGKRIGPGRTP